MATDVRLPPSFWQHAAGGAAGGAAAMLLTAPLDVLKTRLQAHGGGALVGAPRGAGMWSMLRGIAATEGVRALWRGSGVSLIGSVHPAVHFGALGAARRVLDERTALRGAPAQFVASTVAGMVAMFTMSPVWVVKTVQQLQAGRGLTMADTSRLIWRTDGLRGFYRGFSVALVGSLDGTIMYMLYQRIKLWIGDDGSPGSFALLIASALVAKTVSGTAFYPTEVIRTRLRQQAFGSVM